MMVTLVFGAAHRHFDDESARLCRACSRACGEPATIAACEALVVSSPSLSGQHQMRLSEAQLDGLRESLRLLRDDYACRGGVVLLERLLALDVAALRRSGLLLLPVPSGFEVSISNRRGDAYVQGVLVVVGAAHGQVRVRDVVAGRVFDVSLDRLDRRVNDPRYRIIGDSRATLEAKIEAKDLAIETMRVASERAVGALHAEITQLQADTTAQVLKCRC